MSDTMVKVVYTESRSAEVSGAPDKLEWLNGKWGAYTKTHTVEISQSKLLDMKQWYADHPEVRDQVRDLLVMAMSRYLGNIPIPVPPVAPDFAAAPPCIACGGKRTVGTGIPCPVCCYSGVPEEPKPSTEEPKP